MPASRIQTSAAPKASRHAALWLTCALLLVAVWRVWSFQAPAQPGYDESVYLHYVEVFSQQGFGGLRETIRQARDDAWLKVGPPPFRVLHVVTASALSRGLGGPSISHLALVSALFASATVLLAALLLREWLGARDAALATLLLGFSPLATALARRALQDSFFAFLVVLAVYALHRCLRGGALRDRTGLTLALLACFLTKESTLLLYPALLLIALWRPEGLRASVALLPCFALAPLLALTVQAACSGGVTELAAAYRAYVTQQSQIPYAQQFQSGPWFRYLLDWLMLTPVPLLLAMAGLLRTDVPASQRAAHRLCAILLVVGLGVFGALSMLNARFILPLELPLVALAVLGLRGIAERAVARPSYRALATAVLLVLALSAEVRSFVVLFDRAGLYDPVTAQLAKAWRLIP